MNDFELTIPDLYHEEGPKLLWNHYEIYQRKNAM